MSAQDFGSVSCIKALMQVKWALENNSYVK